MGVSLKKDTYDTAQRLSEGFVAEVITLAESENLWRKYKNIGLLMITTRMDDTAICI
jgi:hypothetical protein